jgi:hypothetical protein
VEPGRERGTPRSRRVAVKGSRCKTQSAARSRRGRQFVGAKSVDAHLRYHERDGVTMAKRARSIRGSAMWRMLVPSSTGAVRTDTSSVSSSRRRRGGTVASADTHPRSDEADGSRPRDEARLDRGRSSQHRPPHTHILVRGITDDGKTLNIAGDYIDYGIRERASEIVNPGTGPADRA